MEVEIASFATTYIALRLAMFSVFSFAIFRVFCLAGVTRSGGNQRFFFVNEAVKARAK